MSKLMVRPSCAWQPLVVLAIATIAVALFVASTLEAVTLPAPGEATDAQANVSNSRIIQLRCEMGGYRYTFCEEVAVDDPAP